MKKLFAVTLLAIIASGMTCRQDPEGINEWARDLETIAEGVTKYTLLENPEKRDQLISIRDKIRSTSGTITFREITAELLPLAKNLKSSDAVLIGMGAQLLFDRLGGRLDGLPSISPLATSVANGMTDAIGD